jgi:membrane protease YdiL (CAAX protease family)
MKRQLIWYFGGLIAVYVAGVAIFWPDSGEQDGTGWALVIMFAPTAGAVLAKVFAGASIRWGRPNWWIFAGLLPTVFALAAYEIGAALGWDTVDIAVLRSAIAGAPLAILLGALSAIGEEIGWRGFLWPALRPRMRFLRVSLIVGAVWWLYHVPLILLGWYGTIGGIPAFTVALAGFALFVGVLTDRSGSLWPSVVAHAGWNSLVATGFDADGTPAFTGSEVVVGEFGWLAAVSSLLLGVLATWWHLSRPMPVGVVEHPAPGAAADRR